MIDSTARVVDSGEMPVLPARDIDIVAGSMFITYLRQRKRDNHAKLANYREL